MKILPLISLALLVLVLMNMLAKARPYQKGNPPGKVLEIASLSILSKIHFYRFDISALITGLGLTSLAGWLPVHLVLMMAAFPLVILLLPVKMTLTSQGISIGEGNFRAWSEFTGMKRNGRKLEIHPLAKIRKVVLFLNPDKNLRIINTIESHIPAHLPNG